MKLSLNSTLRSVVGSAVFLALTCGPVGCSSADSDGFGSQQEEQVEPTYYPAPATGPQDENKALELLNQYRTLAGLDPVSVDQEASQECMGHIDYLIWEGQHQHKPFCFLSHTEEDHNNPYYSEEHENAGKGSVIACGMSTATGAQTLQQAIELWMNSLYHRLPLLQPGLRTVGIAWKDGYSCVYYRKGTKIAKVESPVLWPADHMEDVPTTFVGHEFPCPTKPDNPLDTRGFDCGSSGFIITASWFGHGNQWLTAFDANGLNLSLIEKESGRPVELLATYVDRVQGHDPAPRHTVDTVTWVPKAPLAPETTYEVHFAGSVNRKPTELSWTFTTGTRSQ